MPDCDSFLNDDNVFAVLVFDFMFSANALHCFALLVKSFIDKP